MELLTTQNFETSVKTGVSLVDFYAEWCGPCQMLKPYLEAMSHDYAGRVTFYKVDIDQSYDIAGQYWITAMPTLKIFVDGIVKETIVGMDLAKIHSALEAHAPKIQA